jgi:hypothetical protein
LIAKEVVASQEGLSFMELVLYKCEMLSVSKEKVCGFIREFENGCSGYYFGPKRVIIREG